MSEKSIRSKALAVLVLGALALVAVLGGAGTSRDPGPGRGLVVHVRVADDIETTAMAEGIEEAIRVAGGEHAAGVLLELSGNAVRSDLAWRLGSSMDEADVPVWVFLAGGGDNEVGAGQLELAVRADAAWMAGAVAAAWEGPAACEPLAPADLDGERVLRERYSGLWVALQRRGADEQAANALLRPSGTIRATRVLGGSSRLVVGPVAPQDAEVMVTLIEPLAGGGSAGRVDCEMAIALKLVDGEARHARDAIRQALAGDVDRARRTRRITIENGLADALDRGRALLGSARAAEAGAAAALRRRLGSGLGDAAYRRARVERARRALGPIAEGEAAVRALEELARRTPELLRTRAPDQADLPGVEADAGDAWRRAIESLRRSLADARARAEADL
ncbi:MAG: hypothetical protein AAFX79_10575 [Planctomycetota bacterium]